jgi:hypothetical protein
MSMTELLEQLLVYCRENGRVCPLPHQWNRLWEMLPNRSRAGAGWKPPAPLILAAWWETSDEMKQERVGLHLNWAAEHGAFDDVANFLRALPEREWHHRGD